jgi:hypothetical protein
LARRCLIFRFRFSPTLKDSTLQVSLHALNYLLIKTIASAIPPRSHMCLRKFPSVSTTHYPHGCPFSY